MTPERASLFSAVENLIIPSLLGAITLRGGCYSDGEGAVKVYSDQDDPLLTLTHNMDPQAMALAAEREGFWVKVNEPSQLRTAVLAGLIRSGLFKPCIPPVYTGAGWVERYAQLWMFRRCVVESHPGRWGAAVLCADCLALAQAGRLEVEEVQEEFRAADITINPSVNYLSLLVEDEGGVEILGEFIVTSLPDPPAGSDSIFDADLSPSRTEAGDPENVRTEQAEGALQPGSSWCGTPAPDPIPPSTTHTFDPIPSCTPSYNDSGDSSSDSGSGGCSDSGSGD